MLLCKYMTNFDLRKNNKTFCYFRKKKKKDRTKVKDEKINIKENQDKINHGMLTFIIE